MTKSTRTIYQEMLKSKRKIAKETKNISEQKNINKALITPKTQKLKETFFSFFNNKKDNTSKEYKEMINTKIQSRKSQKADRFLYAITINDKILNEKNIEQIISTLQQSISKDSLVYKSLQDMPKQIKDLKNYILEAKTINKNQYQDLEIKIDTEENTLKAIETIKKLKQQIIEQLKEEANSSAKKLTTQILNLEFLIKSHHEKMLHEKNQKTFMEKQNAPIKENQYKQEKKPLNHVQQLKQSKKNRQINK